MAHEPLLKEGTRPEAIDVLRHQRSTDGLEPREALIIDVVRTVYRRTGFRRPVQARRGGVSRPGLVEIIVLAGYYGLIGYALNAFEADLPEGATQPF